MALVSFVGFFSFPQATSAANVFVFAVAIASVLRFSLSEEMGIWRETFYCSGLCSSVCAETHQPSCQAHSLQGLAPSASDGFMLSAEKRRLSK